MSANAFLANAIMFFPVFSRKVYSCKLSSCHGVCVLRGEGKEHGLIPSRGTKIPQAVQHGHRSKAIKTRSEVMQSVSQSALPK